MSRLVLQRRGSDLSSEFVVSSRETVYQSPIWLTPYQRGGAAIDVARLRSWFENAYRQAGLGPEALDTGAVVITGEALKKENAEPIAHMLAEWSGRFVCVSAGPYHEGVLAAHGSGAVALSQSGERPGRRTVVNVDIGGGTTKVSVARDGEICHVEAFSVGARLIAFDENDILTRIEEPARVMLKRLGIPAELGDPVTVADRQRLADHMADTLLAVLTGGVGPRPSSYHDLFVFTDGRPMPDFADIDVVVFSGGVSEYLAPAPPASFGDLGDLLGRALRARLPGLAPDVRDPHEHDARPFTGSVQRAPQGIRATVVGASQYTVQASGLTCYLSDPQLLPVHGLRAVRVDFADGDTAPPDAIARALAHHGLVGWHAGLVAAVTVASPTTYPHLRACAEALNAAADPEVPLFIVLRQDLAHSLGGIIREELGRSSPVIVVDGITVGELDHVDLGRPLGVSKSLPVTVTSLLFPHAHHHDRSQP